MIGRRWITLWWTVCSIVATAPVAAQETKQRVGVASVSFNDSCPEADARPSLAGADNIVVTGSAGFPSLLGGLIGNLAGAGLNAIGKALDEAGKASTVGGEGRVNFEYYAPSSRSGKLVPRVGGDGFACLIVEVPGVLKPYDPVVALSHLPVQLRYDATTRQIVRTDKAELTPEDVKVVEPLLTAPRSVALYLEARVTPLKDGVALSPAYIAYREALPSLSNKKRLAAELQVTLSGAVGIKDGSSAESIFGISRIKLPPLAVGDVWWEEQLAVTGGILPHRPVDGSAAAMSASLAPVTALRESEAGVRSARLRLFGALGLSFDEDNELVCDTLEPACAATVDAHEKAFDDFGGLEREEQAATFVKWALAPNSDYDADQRTAIKAAVKSDKDARIARSIAASATRSLLGWGGRSDEDDDEIDTSQLAVGSTSLGARLVLITDERKFLRILGQALAGQSDAAKTAVTSKVTNLLTPEPTWSTERSAYQVAMALVSEQRVTLATTQAGTDTAAVATAKTELVRRKTAANEKAAAANVPIPFPDPSS